MIEPGSLALIQQVVALKRHNVHAYHGLCKALQDLSDPIIRQFIDAPPATLQWSQGRSKLITTMLDVFFKCEELLAEHERSQLPAAQRMAPPSKEAAFHG